MANTDDLVSDIDAVRERLAGTIDQLVDRARPQTIARRGVDQVKAKFIDDTGSPRLDVIAPIAGAVVGVVALGIVMRRLLR